MSAAIAASSNNCIKTDCNSATLHCNRLCKTFLAAAPPGIAVLTTSSTLCRRYAPEQGTRPDTVNLTIKLRLLVMPTAPVSTAISCLLMIAKEMMRKKYKKCDHTNFVTTHVVRLKVFRLKAEKVKRTQLQNFGEETTDFFTKYGFKTCNISVFPNSLQPTA